MAALEPAAAVFGVAPGWVYPSMVSAPVASSIVGSGVAASIVFTPEPGMAK